MITTGHNQEDFSVGINLEKKIIGDLGIVDEFNSESPESTKGELELIDKGDGLVVNMAAGSIIEGLREIRDRLLINQGHLDLIKLVLVICINVRSG